MRKQTMNKEILNMKDLNNAKELLNECKNFYKKDDLSDLTEEEITTFIWMTAAKMVDDEQRDLFNKIGW